MVNKHVIVSARDEVVSRPWRYTNSITKDSQVVMFEEHAWVILCACGEEFVDKGHVNDQTTYVLEEKSHDQFKRHVAEMEQKV